MGLTKLALRFAAPVPNIENYQRFLFIGPHPDDIEIGAGATAAKLAAAGKDICFLICTDGRFGDGNVGEEVTRKQLIEMRKREAVQSAERLGITDVRFLGLSDGGFYKEKELRREIAGVIGDFQPEVLLAPDPCVSSECHMDHLNVGNAVRRLACFAAYDGIMKGYESIGAPVKVLAYYMTAKPNRFVGTRGYLKKQLNAVFESHVSQFPPGCEEAKSISLYLKLRAAEFGIRSLKGCAEGFRVLGTLHMHCLPELND